MRFFDSVTKRPALTIAATIAVVALGARALTGLESSVDPGVGRPAIGITVRYSGALPADVERQVVRPIERRVAGVRGIVRTEATAREGVGRVVLYFDYLSHLEDAFQPIHDSVDVVRTELPPGAETPVIAQIDPAPGAAVVLLDGPRSPGASVASVGLGALEGALLALLTVLCAARSWRLALIVLLSAGVTAVGVVEILAVAGLQLTPATVLGVALATMFLVDDAVTVRESIAHQIELGVDIPAAASPRAMGGGCVDSQSHASPRTPCSDRSQWRAERPGDGSRE